MPVRCALAAKGQHQKCLGLLCEIPFCNAIR